MTEQHYVTWDSKEETKQETAARFERLYFGRECCCGGRIHEDTGIRELLHHIWHALCCRAGRCAWTRKEGTS